ncbi:Ascorbate-specific phosphotransferase enzyme IIA component [Mycobacteroides abscessus subsp. abscessus]|nr:Ascorbate-specific phosphotransferase enzyme IIA component [Mycobacteroides abscessus subsp. abscessus]
MVRLSDLISVPAIQLEVDAEDWRSAIQHAGALLADVGVAGPSYTQAMVDVVEENGPYIVITPGFALAHARPDASVTATGLSFVRLAAPVRFGHASNDPVTIVMALAAQDPGAHQQALASLAQVLGDTQKRAALDDAATPEEVLEVFASAPTRAPSTGAPRQHSAQQRPTPDDPAASGDTIPSKNLLLTVCGNGLGTSLFLKNTTEQVLDRWGWSPYLSVEATDTISAKGRAKEADFLLTSGAIAQTLGDVGVPVEVIENFSSQEEVDAALRRRYAI